MFKNFFNYRFFLSIFLLLVVAMGFGSVVKYHYEGGEKYQILQKAIVTISSVPINLRVMIKNRSLNLDLPKKLQKHKDKKKFEQFIAKNRNALLVLSRYDHSLKRSIVDIIDLNNFETIHSYNYDIAEINERVDNVDEFPRLKIDLSPERVTVLHPLLFADGSLTSHYGPLFKIDFCSNLKWINDEEIFHHSQMLDHEGNIWVAGKFNPKSKYVKKHFSQKYNDDSIIKLSTEGKILLKKSVTEILIENNLIDINFIRNRDNDPIHLNDIEPALTNTDYWLQGDLFISSRNQSAIIQYRPSSNRIINYITGPFAQQHDVDIISDKEISIFNNNNFIIDEKHSEVLVYNFETNKFRKLFNNQLKNNNFETQSNGLSEILDDGSLMVEETIHGRIILFDQEGKKEWEFVNKDDNGDIGRLGWSRIMEDVSLIEKFKKVVKNNKC